MTGPKIITFGCRLNAYESEVMRGHAEAAGLDNVIIFNTCAVTAEAERQSRQAIRKARREHPGARIIVTGCAAQLAPDRYAGMEEVDRVIGNREKLLPEYYFDSDAARVSVDDIMSVRETAGHLITGFAKRARAFVQIQQGCDHRCTFCIIPFARGPSRSVPIGVIVDEVRTLVAAGCGEVVLSGVDITDYGADLPGKPTLGQMMRRLFALAPELPRLRLSSIDPVEVDDDLLALAAEEPRLMPHFHLSLQAGDDTILKRMKRRHSRLDAIRICEDLRARRPDVVFGADLIAGFPTETDDMFANTLALIDDCGLTYLHVFPYSERPGTPASRMPQIPKAIRRERAALLREAGERRLGGFLDRWTGETINVLIEDGRNARSEHFAPVRLDHASPPGGIIAARIERRAGLALEASVAA
jgi:threonylcarbamoyladenosine tRNA methylthiotransferase MtaB